MTAPARPRFLPDEPLPPYAYVPGGRFPHPVSDTNGHSHGHVEPPAVSLVPDHWPESCDFLRGIDLFNHGYYWEAHEAWERLWHAAGRHGATAELLQGLIKLAASGVKVREGRSVGTIKLAEGARILFARAQSHLSGQPTYLGLRFADLLAFTQLAEAHATDIADNDPGVRIVFPFILHPRSEPDS